MRSSVFLVAVSLLIASGAALAPAEAQPLRSPQVASGDSDAAATAPEAARPIREVQVLPDPDDDPLSRFGDPTAISGDRALVSAVRNGTVFAYERIDGVWTLTQRITAPPMARTFGNALAVDGDRALIADQQHDATGAVYVYEVQNGTWTETARFFPPGLADFDAFGSSVVLEGDRAVVGAVGVNGRDGRRDNDGAAWVFELIGDTWTETTKLTASDPSKDAFFGSEVALSGDRLLIGASGDEPQPNSLGAVYGFAFDGTTWTQQAKLTADLGHQGSFARGQGIALDGGRALIGLTSYVEPGVFTPSVYTYEASGGGWIRTGTIVLLGTVASPFGAPRVVIDGDDALIAASAGSEDPNGSVYIYAFENGPWAEADHFTIEDDGTTHGVGLRIALSDGTAFITDNNLIQDPDKYLGRILAFDLEEAGPEVSLAITSYNSTPERGESVFFRGPSTNLGSETVPVYYYFVYETPDGRTRRTNLGGTRLPPGQTINFRQFRKNFVLLPTDAPEGDYTVTVYAAEGGRTGPTLASDQFVLTLGPLAAAPHAPEAKTAAPAAGPNPFRDRTTITYTLDPSAEVDLRVVDALGREVAVLASGVQAEGAHSAVFDAHLLPSGVYLWRLRIGGEVTTGRMTLAR